MQSPFEHWDLQLKYRLLFPALSRLPRRLSYRLASLYGRWEYVRQEVLATQIAHQMRRALPGHADAQYRQWTRYFYGLQQREILDTWYYPRLRRAEQVGRSVEVENFDQVLAVRREGRPLIFTGAHLGRFWMLGVTVAAYGIATGALARDDEQENTWGLPEPEFNYRKLKLSRLRQCYRGDFLMPGTANMRPLLQALQQNPVAILLDVPYGKESPGLVGVPFFGKEAYFPEGTIKIAKRTGALIQPFCVDEHRQGLTLRFLPAHETEGKSSEELLAVLVRGIEQRIRQNPGKWWQWRALPMFWGEV
ncbi:MAG: lysophospholipid acyltransferase family protein [Candidatus Thiodiazotropha sp. (ex Dulcina madagascariensis)]|nr:lysophospholipid acyltransferase family protein [Candidatus Thiodiazotropha sp. (ex Dulcina madagascariensis)]MCU7925763.1 lysophospholipid acyltransferase family protein [Candidatus Thiodiazotropha sp. (ex Dulcina madagascariensis)]